MRWNIFGIGHRRGRSAPLPDLSERQRRVIARVRHFTMTSPERIAALVTAIEYVVGNGVPGCLVECGVWRGGSMMAAALTLAELGELSRQLYLFDTFDGMTPPGANDRRHDGRTASDILAKFARSRDNPFWAIASLREVRSNLSTTGYPEENSRLIEGPVEETLPRTETGPIALLRLDTDWYESTRHELTHLYPRLARGGVLLIDDYGYWKGARKAVDEYFNENPPRPLLVRVDDTGRLAVKLHD
jgi:O-methyltransferase